MSIKGTLNKIDKLEIEPKLVNQMQKEFILLSTKGENYSFEFLFWDHRINLEL